MSAKNTESGCIELIENKIRQSNAPTRISAMRLRLH